MPAPARSGDSSSHPWPRASHEQGPSQNARSDYQSRMPEQEPASRSRNAERTRACRERLKAAGRDRAERPPCLLCGKLIALGSIDPDSVRGQSRTGLVLCTSCWRKSDDGRAAERVRGKQRRPRRKAAAKERRMASATGLSETTSQGDSGGASVTRPLGVTGREPLAPPIAFTRQVW